MKDPEDKIYGEITKVDEDAKRVMYIGAQGQAQWSGDIPDDIFTTLEEGRYLPKEFWNA